MFSSSTLVLLVTALTCVWAQDFLEERKITKKSKAKPQVANIHDGQGKKMNENISFAVSSSSFCYSIISRLKRFCVFSFILIDKYTTEPKMNKPKLVHVLL